LVTGAVKKGKKNTYHKGELVGRKREKALCSAGGNKGEGRGNGRDLFREGGKRT